MGVGVGLVCLLFKLVRVGLCNLHLRELLQHTGTHWVRDVKKTCVQSLEPVFINCVQDI